MPLTTDEKLVITQRAAGSFAAIPRLTQIVSDHRKNRTLEDEVYLEFARMAVKTLCNWGDYEPLARAVLELAPEDFWTPSWRRGSVAQTKSKGRRKSRKRTAAQDLIELFGSTSD